MNIQLDNEDQSFLIKVVRDALYSKLINEDLPVYYNTKEIYSTKCGVFVKTLLNNTTRSYGGILSPQTPLIKTLQDCAVSSAFNDVRLKPLGKEEWEKIHIFIALVESVELVVDKRMINPIEHGLITELSWHQGILLPWDIKEANFTIDDYIKETALKAGISDLEHVIIKKMNCITFHENK